jgi:hypothetical protein
MQQGKSTIDERPALKGQSGVEGAYLHHCRLICYVFIGVVLTESMSPKFVHSRGCSAKVRYWPNHGAGHQTRLAMISSVLIQSMTGQMTDQVEM